MAAPTEKQALAALKTVQELSGFELDALIKSELGTPMLGVIDSLARAVLPKATKDEHHSVVHLMVLSYLMRRENERKPS